MVKYAALPNIYMRFDFQMFHDVNGVGYVPETTQFILVFCGGHDSQTSNSNIIYVIYVSLTIQLKFSHFQTRISVVLALAYSLFYAHWKLFTEKASSLCGRSRSIGSCQDQH